MKKIKVLEIPSKQGSKPYLEKENKVTFPQLEKEIKHLKDWLQVWIINKEKGEDWRKLMEKELYGKEK